jgi:hypothetical protein
LSPASNHRSSGSSELHTDPRIEAFQARRELEIKEALLRLILSGAFAAVLIGAAIVADFGVGIEIAIAISTEILGYGFSDYMDTRGQKAKDFGDLLTLSSVFYQSPATINELLKPERVNASIANLLQASLGKEIGDAYWRQAVAPYILHGKRGFKENWRYDIDLKDLTAATMS